MMDNAQAKFWEEYIALELSEIILSTKKEVIWTSVFLYTSSLVRWHQEMNEYDCNWVTLKEKIEGRGGQLFRMLS